MVDHISISLKLALMTMTDATVVRKVINDRGRETLSSISNPDDLRSLSDQ